MVAKIRARKSSATKTAAKKASTEATVKAPRRPSCRRDNETLEQFRTRVHPPMPAKLFRMPVGELCEALGEKTFRVWCLFCQELERPGKLAPNNQVLLTNKEIRTHLGYTEDEVKVAKHTLHEAWLIRSRLNMCFMLGRIRGNDAYVSEHTCVWVGAL